MSTSSIGVIVQAYVADVSTVLTENLPLILGVAAGLFGLGLIIRQARKHIK